MAKMILPPKIINRVIITCCDRYRKSLLYIHKKPIPLRKLKHSFNTDHSYFELMHELNMIERNCIKELVDHE